MQQQSGWQLRHLRPKDMSVNRVGVLENVTLKHILIVCSPAWYHSTPLVLLAFDRRSVPSNEKHKECQFQLDPE